MSDGLFFPQQVSGSSGSVGNSEYVQDSFNDYSLPGTNNTSLTSTVSTNPLNEYFGNDLSVKYSIKTLYVKDLILEEDRSKWVNGGRTYRVVFTENFPGIYCYVVGTARVLKQINGTSIGFTPSNIENNIIGVSGQILKASFILEPHVNTANATQSMDYSIDGAVPTSVSYTNISNENNQVATRQFELDQRKYFLLDDGSANQTNDIHDFKITSTDWEFPELLGVVVYLSTQSDSVFVRPGSNFVDKELISTTVGSSFALPAQNASLFHLGAKTNFFVNSSGVLGATTYVVPKIQTQATGLVDTNTVAVSPGTGASYTLGVGVHAQMGTSHYYGIVSARTTDTLTVSPTLPFALSGATFTKAFFAQQPPTDARNFTSFSNSIYELAYSWDPMTTYGLTNWQGFSAIYAVNGPTVLPGISAMPYTPYYDPENRFVIIPITGASSAQGRIGVQAGIAGWQGPLSVKGDFQAIELEISLNPLGGVGGGFFSTSRTTIDGITLFPAGGMTLAMRATLSNAMKFPVVQDLGIGFHTLKWIPDRQAGHTFSPCITKINMYKYKGVSIAGQLHEIEQLQTQFDYQSFADTVIGAYKFFGSDKLSYSGSWFKSFNTLGLTLTSFPGMAQCVSGATSNSVLSFKYYGKNFALYTDSAGGSYTTTLDGAAITPVSGQIYSVATEMIHTLVLTRASGTFGIQGIAILKDYNEIKSLQKLSATPLELNGENFIDKSISIRKSAYRERGQSVGIGGFAISRARINDELGATTTPAWLGNVTADVTIETSGNPVFVGLSSDFQRIDGTTLPGIYLAGSATLGCFMNLWITRFSNGSTAYQFQDADEVAPYNKISSFIFGNKIGTTTGFIFGHSYRYSADSVKAIDLPPPGIWTYRFFWTVEGAGSTASILNCREFAMEMF